MISEIVRKWRTSKNYDGNREHDDPLEFHKVAQRVYQWRAKQKPNGEHIQDGPYLIDFFLARIPSGKRLHNYGTSHGFYG
jgi:hypothetical protein